MSAKTEEPVVSLSITKLLTDKLYEKRKLGALEIEQMVRDSLKRQDERVCFFTIVCQSRHNISLVI